MKKSGIYKILNIQTNEFYIGSSIDLNKRFLAHNRMLYSNSHHSIHLQNSYNKHGFDYFWFIILELCDKEEILNREQFYLNSLNPKYNISKDSTAPMTGRKHSQNTIEKFKNREVICGEEHYRHGTKWSDEEREKILKARLETNYKHSEETRKKMSETNKRLNRAKDLEKHIEASKRKIIDSNGNIFNSMIECAKFWNISPSTVCDILKGRHFQTRKKIKFKYYDNA